jgi:hypothetical protein
MEKKNTAIVANEIHLKSVEVAQQKMDLAAFKKNKSHKLNVGHKFLHNLKDERVKLEFVFAFSDEEKHELLSFQIDFHFQIDHLQNFYELNESDLPIFKSHLLGTLIGIAFSTARGIIFEKLSNAGVPNVLIPVVSPQQMLKKSTSNP